MTPRDRQIYHFIDMVGLCTVQEVKSLFFKDVDITKAYQRLRVLVSEGLVKVQKVGLNNYYYTNKKTSKKMLEHDLKTSEMVAYLASNGAEILNFHRNKKIGHTLKEQIITDGYIAYKIKVGEKTYKRHFIIEVQRSVQFVPNKVHGALYTCIEKYNHDTVSEGLKRLAVENGFKTVPPLLVVTDIKDETSLVLNTNLIKLPYNKTEKWELLIR